MTAAELIAVLRHADPAAPVVLQVDRRTRGLDFVVTAGAAVLVADPPGIEPAYVAR